MNGAGTKENPYIIMNADDLYSMENVGNSEAYFLLGADIDFNDTQYAEKFKPITLNCKVFSGNGHTIRNVNYSSPEEEASMFILADNTENMTVENLRTENIRLVGKGAFIFRIENGNCSLSLEHCVLVMNEMTTLSSMQASSESRHCIIHGSNIKVSADYCTFVVNVNFFKIYAMFSDDTLSHSQIKAEIHTNSLAYKDDAYNAFLSGTKVSDSYFFMEVYYDSTTLGNFIFSSSNSTFSKSYLVFEGVKGISNVHWYGSIGSICFFDSNVLRKHNINATVVNSSSNLYSLSTERCKDPVYLRSIGFNCVGADE